MEILQETFVFLVDAKEREIGMFRLVDSPFLGDLHEQKDHEGHDYEGYQRYQEVSYAKQLPGIVGVGRVSCGIKSSRGDSEFER